MLTPVRTRSRITLPRRARVLQFFFNYISSKEADNIPSCMACVSQELEAIRNPDEVLENPQDFFDPSQPVFSTDRVRPGCCRRQSTSTPGNLHHANALNLALHSAIPRGRVATRLFWHPESTACAGQWLQASAMQHGLSSGMSLRHAPLHSPCFGLFHVPRWAVNHDATTPISCITGAQSCTPSHRTPPPLPTATAHA